MCLTICRKREFIYDNDRIFDCRLCPFKNKTEECQTCENCLYFGKDEKGNTFCSMTSMSTPKANWCCHWNSQSMLSYFKHNLKSVDGIVLVSGEQLEEAKKDYQPSMALKDKQTNLSLDDWLNEDCDFSVKPTEEIIEEIEEIAYRKMKKSDIYGTVSEADTLEKVYVPVRVGDDLIENNGGLDGVVAWFEAIFGGKEDILKDWKGRWIVKPVRFAIPAVYGLISDEWSDAIGEDVSDLIHDLFT